MGRIVASENVTLDGVIQDPAGDEGFRLGGWVGHIQDRPAVGKAALDEALGAEALLLGRRTYEFFAARWPSRSGALADRLNSLPKYVVSSTLERGETKSQRCDAQVRSGRFPAICLAYMTMTPAAWMLSFSLLKPSEADLQALVVIDVMGKARNPVGLVLGRNRHRRRPSSAGASVRSAQSSISLRAK
jgi:hypothetical protein